MEEKEEIWRDIEGYEGLYQVSNFGRVKSLKDRYGNPREKILKFGKTKDGYLIVNFCKNKKKKTCKVHRLVANAFIDNPSNLPQVNHKDEDKTNNVVDNLEFCDAKYNQNYGTAIQRRVASTNYKVLIEKRKIDYKGIAEKLTNRQDLSRQVYQYTKDLKLIKIWQSTREADRNGYNQGAVSKCCNNCFNREGNNVYKGYIWSYTELKK